MNKEQEIAEKLQNHRVEKSEKEEEKIQEKNMDIDN